VNQPKRLLIISHTPHYVRAGKVAGWGSTVREIDELSTLFDSVVHIAPMYAEAAPASAIAYQSPRVRLRAVAPAGGERFVDKLGIPLRYPGYVGAILREARVADIIHVRAPANISLLALLLLGLLRHPPSRWVKYAGDWSGGNSEPWSYRFQRWWLARGFHRGMVTANGTWPNQPGHVHSFLNPCLTEAEIEEGADAGQLKRLNEPVRLLFVGRMESAKGAGVCLEILAHLQTAGIAARLDLIGEGPEREMFERRAVELGVSSWVSFQGGLPRASLGHFYDLAHFILLPSVCSEGWPKVLSEAMAYGAVPIATSISSIPQFLKTFSTGQTIHSPNPKLFSDVIQAYLRDPARWREDSSNALKAASRFSYGNYLRAVAELLKLPIAEEEAVA
jgi:glycosyltransferase involved in cell wall biosynthesis